MMRTARSKPAALMAACALAFTAASAAAQDTSTTQPAPSFAVELNALQPTENGCRISFLVTNGLGGALDVATAEIALFNTAGAIERIVSLDFKALPNGKTKVLQFNVPGLQCDGVGRLLINDITACTGEGIEPTACLANIKTTAVPDVPFGI